jgi:hypothetical protein
VPPAAASPPLSGAAGAATVFSRSLQTSIQTQSMKHHNAAGRSSAASQWVTAGEAAVQQTVHANTESGW